MKRGMILLLGTVLMVVLMLAAGGIYLLPKDMAGVFMYADVWNSVGGLFSLSCAS